MSFNSAHFDAYDRRTVRLHWLTAFLVVALWCLGQTIDWFPKGSPRTTARSSHIVLGAILAAVIVHRIWWRATSGRHLPSIDEGIVRIVSKWTHRALYLLVCVTVALGITNAWIRGDSIFDLLRIPSFAPDDKALRGSIEDLHGLSANIFLAIAGFHALAGLAHQYLWKDQLMRRMSLWSNR